MTEPRSTTPQVFRRWDDGFVVRQMTSDDVAIVEGWYSDICPTSIDLTIAHRVSAESGFALDRFLIGDLNGQTIASMVEVNIGSHISYGSLFYVDPRYRMSGLGRRINDVASEVGDLLGFVVGIDAHDELEAMNHRRGYRTAFKVTQYQGKVEARSADGIGDQSVSIKEITDDVFDSVVGYDDQCFVISGSDWRRRLLSQWFAIPGGKSVVALGGSDGQTVLGYCSRRPAKLHPANHIIGPLYADNLGVARRLVAALTADIIGETIWINICEPNNDVLSLVKELNLVDSLHMLRMYRNELKSGENGANLKLQPTDKVFAITSIDVCGH